MTKEIIEELRFVSRAEYFRVVQICNFINVEKPETISDCVIFEILTGRKYEDFKNPETQKQVFDFCKNFLKEKIESKMATEIFEVLSLMSLIAEDIAEKMDTIESCGRKIEFMKVVFNMIGKSNFCDRYFLYHSAGKMEEEVAEDLGILLDKITDKMETPTDDEAEIMLKEILLFYFTTSPNSPSDTPSNAIRKFEFHTNTGCFNPQSCRND